MSWLLPCLLLLAAGLALSAGCTAPATEQGTQPAVTTPAGIPSYMVHVAGTNKGTILLVGRSTCPWCMKTKELLTTMGVDFWWIDMGTLSQAEAGEVMASISAVPGCEKVTSVPILVIRGKQCIIGYEEETIRGAIG